MPVRCFIAAFILGLAVVSLAALGSGATNDPFAAMGMLGAYAMIVAAIAGGVLLVLAFSAGTIRKDDRTRSTRPR